MDASCTNLFQIYLLAGTRSELLFDHPGLPDLRKSLIELRQNVQQMRLFPELPHLESATIVVHGDVTNNAHDNQNLLIISKGFTKLTKLAALKIFRHLKKLKPFWANACLVTDFEKS